MAIGWAPVFKDTFHVIEGISSVKNLVVWWLTSNSNKIPGNQFIISLVNKTASLLLKKTVTTSLDLETKISSCYTCLKLTIDIASYPDTQLGRFFLKIQEKFPSFFSNNGINKAKTLLQTLYNFDHHIHNLGHQAAFKLLVKNAPIPPHSCNYRCSSNHNNGLDRTEFNRLELTQIGELVGRKNACNIYYLSGTFCNVAFSTLISKINFIVNPVFPILGLLLKTHLKSSLYNEMSHAIFAFTNEKHPDTVNDNDWKNLYCNHKNVTEILRGSHPLAWLAPLILYMIEESI